MIHAQGRSAGQPAGIEHGDWLQVFPRMAGAARDGVSDGLSNHAVLERQNVDTVVGVDRPMTPRAGTDQLHRP
jgi:hypothetical protein